MEEKRKRELQELSMSDVPWLRKSDFEFPPKRERQKIDRSKLFKKEKFVASITVLL